MCAVGEGRREKGGSETHGSRRGSCRFDIHREVGVLHFSGVPIWREEEGRERGGVRERDQRDEEVEGRGAYEFDGNLLAVQ